MPWNVTNNGNKFTTNRFRMQTKGQIIPPIIRFKHAQVMHCDIYAFILLNENYIGIATISGWCLSPQLMPQPKVMCTCYNRSLLKSSWCIAWYHENFLSQSYGSNGIYRSGRGLIQPDTHASRNNGTGAPLSPTSHDITFHAVCATSVLKLHWSLLESRSWSMSHLQPVVVL